MPKSRLSRRKLLAGAAPLVAAPALSKLVLGGDAHAADHSEHAGHMGHAAMIGGGAPAVGGPADLDGLLHPPPARPHRPGRIADYQLVAHDVDVEVAPG